MQRICVFCGSSDQVDKTYLQAAYQLGETLSAQELTLVFGGGKTGLMGAVADGTLAAGGQVIGVITEGMNTPALAHANLTTLEVAPDLSQRKTRMMQLADAFIALPGGFGTLDEAFEVLTGLQIGDHSKPLGLLNINGYYNTLLKALDEFTAQGFIMSAHRAMLMVENAPLPLIDRLRAFVYPKKAVQAWLREES